jgi:LytS/YehU family sensor histidine kinase
MLYDTENRLVNLQNELDIIKDYVALQQLRLTKNISINYKTEGQAEGLQITPLLFLPIVENAYKHGIDNENDSFIDITIVISREVVEVLVKNKIANKASNKSKTGIGMANIKRRLDLLYPDRHQLEIECGDDIFTVKLKINLGE